MAEVYLAVDRSSDGVRLGVVKRIKPSLADSARHREMFVQEAALAGRLDHPNIVAVYGSDEHDGHPVILMEYVDGVSLRELLLALDEAGGRMPVPVAAHLMAQACAGAHAAHELVGPDGPLGLVHRDLTPHNLMVTDTGHLKILDFGIAQVGEEDEGLIKGKARYLAPEQLQGRPVDRRADVFTLGVVAFELLTGRRPFDHPTVEASRQATLAGRPHDLQALRPDVTLDVVAAIERAFAPDPDDRFPTAAAFAEALATATPPADAGTTAGLVSTLLGPTLAGRRMVIDRALARPLPALGDFDAFRIDTDAEVLEPDPTDSEVRELNSELGPAPASPWENLLPLGIGAAAGVALAAVLARALGGPGTIQDDRLELVVPPTAVDEYGPVARHLTEALGLPVALRAMDADAAVAHLRQAPAVAVLGAHTARGATAAHPGARVVAVELRGASSRHDAVLVGRLAHLRDAEGQVACWDRHRSDVGYHLPRAALADAGIDPDLHLRPRFVDAEAERLRDLAAGRCAVAGVRRSALGEADAAVRVLAELGGVPNPLWVAGPAVSAETTRALATGMRSWMAPGGVAVAGDGALTGLLPPE